MVKARWKGAVKNGGAKCLIRCGFTLLLRKVNVSATEAVTLMLCLYANSGYGLPCAQIPRASR